MIDDSDVYRASMLVIDRHADGAAGFALKRSVYDPVFLF